ncbi:pentatricopeptide repeat-containing protein At5g27110-like [Cornus florida]|uniref:pentatricopeptide repeat-containing protein At5g27110-like n=1 Tax=Cornus florida TaxID=4283 RepID=UPI002899387A|nr:pentatricopeptide repeat-containing protein At5g27110-like [Cornus florida]XP_059659665.1 pentatricopeptide repeat-containing protein At5g27110-like [Cornus florida]
MDTIMLLSLLRACINSKSLKQGKLIHQKVVTLGLQNNISLCKSVINLYFSCHSFESAKLVFQTIDNPLDISLWNGLAAAYTSNCMFIEALELFERLLHFPYLKPDSYTFPSVLKACSGLGRVDYGKMIHTHVIKSGFFSDVVVTSSLLRMYARCNVFGSAVQLFDEMPERDVACWNTLISSYYQNGQCEKALELFEKMKGFGFEPDSVTLTTAISSCTRLLDFERGKGIHKELVRSGFALDGFISTALVDMYGKCGCLEMAKELFEKIPRKSLVSWNSLISGYSSIGDVNSCIELFRRMNAEGIKSTSTTLSSLLMASSRSAKLQHGKFIHGHIIRNHLEADLFINSSLVDLYFKCGRVQLAEIVFGKMPKTNVVAWNVMISGYVSVGCYFEALGIFTGMKQAGIKPDAITFTSILAACSQLAALEQGKEIHKCITESKLEPNEIVMGALLDMYAKCGAVDEALSVFNKLPERDIVSWTSMIMAYGSHGQAFEALQLFNKLQRSNMKLDRITFLAVMSACSHAGLVDEGCYYFNLMTTDYGIKPTIEDYSCLMDLLGRAGRLHEAYEILQKNPDIKENGELLSTLFSACHMHGESELGGEIARFLIEKDPDDPSSYIILANMYASMKKWDDALKVRLKMKDLGLKKNPGCSWIEVNKRIQTFLVEDKSHPEAEMVYECLSFLASHMEKDELLSC